MPVTLSDFPTTFDERIAELDAGRAQLLEAISAIGEDAGARPAEGWSAAEIVYHLHLSEKGVARILQKALGTPGVAAGDAQLREEWDRVRLIVGLPTYKVQAPARIVPQDAPALDACLRALAESRLALLEVLRGASVEDLCAISVRHPFEMVGTLSGLGWISATAFHEVRHAGQARALGGAARA